MKWSAKYVGLDVHQSTSVASVREEGGRVIARSVVPTDPTALLEFVQGMRGPVAIALEEGTQSQWLHDLFSPVVDRVVVCNRRGQAYEGHKGDQSDADELSDLLRCGRLRAVYHGSSHRAALRELARAYQQLVIDSTRTMLRLKAVFRARAIRTPGKDIYQAARAGEWLARLPDAAVRFRAEALYAQLGQLQDLRRQAKQRLIAEAQGDPAWPVLRRIPQLGPVRVAQLLATVQTPSRFRTKRQLWAYAGLAVVTRGSAEYDLRGGTPVRRSRAPLTRGLNRNHNAVVKSVFKGAALAAATRSGPLQDWYRGLLARGLSVELARVTLARKIAALTLRLWKTGGQYDPVQLSIQAR